MEGLQESHLVQELQQRSEDLEKIPVLIGNEVWKVYEVDGGYSPDSDMHIVELIVPLQKPGGPPPSTQSGKHEIHVEGAAFWMDVVEAVEVDGDDDSLRLAVETYTQEPFSFADELNTDVDKRETEFSHE